MKPEEMDPVALYHRLLDAWLDGRRRERAAYDFIGMRTPESEFKDGPIIEAINGAFLEAVKYATTEAK